jgi:transposase-like protein
LAQFSAPPAAHLGLDSGPARATPPSNAVCCLLKAAFSGSTTYVYGAVSPIEGELDWKISPQMNTEQMNQFLKQVSQAHADEFIVMVVDGASSHRSQELKVPENIRLHRLPGYSPELNPQEHVWDELREKEFPNRVFESMKGVVSQLEVGLPRMAENTQALRSLTAWPWIVSLNLTAN